jgi:hypothetical protein
VTINQDAATPPCTFSLSDTTLSIIAAGEDKTVHVTASNSTCSWTASSNQSWAIITSGASGNGSGDVVVHFNANSKKSQRTATLTIAGQTVSVTQDGAP